MNEPLWRGGINPEIGKKIRIDMEEVQRTATDISYRITDTVVKKESAEHTYDNEDGEAVTETVYFDIDVIKIRERVIRIPSQQYIGLFVMADVYIDNYYEDADIFTRDILRPRVALLLFVRNDKIEGTNKCIYGTVANDWDIVN